MSDFIIFIVGISVAIIAGMGVITSQVFMGYKKPVVCYKEQEYAIDKSA